MNAEFECCHCYKPLGKYYLFELKRYKDETPRPICRKCVKGIITFGELIDDIINNENEEHIEQPLQ